MKYIMINEKNPVIFSEQWVHRDIARLLGMEDSVTSAGHVRLGLSGEIETYLYSDTFNMKPAEDDADIITHLLQKHDKKG